MTPVFKEVAGGVCIVTTRQGYFMQCPLFGLRGFVYAKIGNRFVRLFANGGTTNLGLRVEAIDFAGEPHHADRMGRWVLGNRPTEKPKTAPRKVLEAAE